MTILATLRVSKQQIRTNFSKTNIRKAQGVHKEKKSNHGYQQTLYKYYVMTNINHTQSNKTIEYMQ